MKVFTLLLQQSFFVIHPVFVNDIKNNDQMSEI